MNRPWSLLSQSLLLVVLSSLAVTAWISRDRLGAGLANLQSAADGPSQQSHESAKAEKSGRKRSRGAAPVIVAHVTTQRNDEIVGAIGTARALKSVTLFAKSEGEITSFSLTAGDHIKKGQTLVEIDSAKAELAVDLAKKTLEDAKLKLERARYLQKRNVRSGAIVDDARIAVERAELEVRQAEEELRDKTLSAPFAGVVGIPKVEAGDRITPATELITLDDRSQLLVEFPIAEKFLSRIKVGDEVSGTTPSYPRREFNGRLGHIDSRVDTVSRTVMVRAVLPNGDDLLRPGMSFAIELALPGGEYPAVPELSLQWAQGESYVWRIEGNVVRKTVVETIRRMNAEILIDGPVSKGDLVVVEGVQRLRDGTEVSYQPPEAGPKSEQGSGAPSRESGPPAGKETPAGNDKPARTRRSARSQSDGRG